MIPVFKSKVNTTKILDNLKETLESGWLGLGPNVLKFEKALEQYLRVPHFIALNSGTAALHLCVRSLNLPKGSRVLTTPITFVSTNQVLLYEQLEPVFCDVEKLTGNIDANLIEETINRHYIKAIMVVHIGGYSCDMYKINEIARKYNIPVIEDCCHAMGATYLNRKVGQTNNLCAWSFTGTKNLPTGEGGGISTYDDSKYEWFLKVRRMGIERNVVTTTTQSYPWMYPINEIGYKYNFNDILAAVGLAELEDLDNNNLRRKQMAERYLTKLNNVICTKPDYKPDRGSSYHLLPLFFTYRDRVYNSLIKKEIYPGMHYQSNTIYPMFSKCIQINECRNAKWYSDHQLTLPFHLHLTDSDIDFVIRTIHRS